jgi:hypothetical protein
MSSHLLHKDGDGVGMVWDRYRRAPERQVAVQLGHSARIVSDVCTFAKLRLMFLLRACSKPCVNFRNLEKRYETLFSGIDEAQRHFNCVEYGTED